MPKPIAPRRPSGWLAAASLVLSLTGCHKLQGLAGMGADQAAEPTAPTDSSTRTKHLPNFGPSRKDRSPWWEAATAAPIPHDEASDSRHAGRAAPPFYLGR